jgi:hypothetical protein
MQLGVDILVALGDVESGWQEVAQYGVNLEIGGTSVAQNNYPHNFELNTPFGEVTSDDLMHHHQLHPL